MKPLRLPPNQFPRFYAGGERIEALRGAGTGGPYRPEDWIGSTTTTLGDPVVGLSRIDDGRVLRDVIWAQPEAFLGAEHVRRWGPDPALLVKLLDADERLPVHLHPGRDFARSALGERFGKTEAWVIVSAEPGATVHVGLRAPVGEEVARSWIAKQDAEAMLAALNRIRVAAGDVVLVPAGTLHAIGGGILLLELQEPSDLSVLLEFERFGVVDGSEHLNLGWLQALGAADLGPAKPGRFARRAVSDRGGALEELFDESADPYFRAERIRPRGDPVLLDPSFSILVVLTGAGFMRTAEDAELELRKGDAYLIPFDCGSAEISGDLEAIRCRPPDPRAPEGRW